MTDGAFAHPVFAEDASVGAIADFIAGMLTGDQPKAIAVPGGSTPGPILERLAGEPLDWPRIAVYLTDDRIVPEDHPASNFALVDAALADTGAAIARLEEGFEPPPFDLVWIGMGADGHIASLFPNTDPRADAPLAVQRITPDPLPTKAPFERLTLTLPALVRTRHIMLVINGTEKRAVLDAAIRGENDLPIARLLGAADRAAVPITIFWSAE